MKMFIPFIRPFFRLCERQRQKFIDWKFHSINNRALIASQFARVKYIYKKMKTFLTWKNAYRAISILILTLATLKVFGVTINFIGGCCPKSLSYTKKVCTLLGRAASKLWAVTGAKCYAQLQAVEKLLKAYSKINKKNK